MGVAKRVYLYLASSISLLVLAAGLYDLVAAILGELADAVGASIIGGAPGVGRQQISLAIALMVVGGPLFAIHWSLVGRSWKGDDQAAHDERFSSLRAFHFALVASVALALAVAAAIALVTIGLDTLVGSDISWSRPTDQVAMVVVAIPIWWYHHRRRGRDLRHDRLTGGAAWLTRLYRYAWAFTGLMLLVAATSRVLETLASVLIGREGFAAGDPWWLDPLVASLATLVIGAVVFWIFAWDARGVIRDAAVIGEDDRATALRATYFGAVILVALVDGTVSIASALAEVARWALGVAGSTDVRAFLEGIVGPLLVAIPFVVAGWLHWSAQRREATDRSPAARAAADRLAFHLTAAVGIACLAVGLAQLLGRLIEVAVGDAGVDRLFREELAWMLALIVVGAALWIPAWTAILRRRAVNPLTERLAVTGRAYLFIVVGASLLAAVPSAAYTLFRLIDTLLGSRAGALGADLAIPVAVVIVASVAAAYHGRLLLSDLRLTADVAPPPPEAARPVATMAEPQWSVTLTLRGPAGTDPESIARKLRDDLPAGVSLEAR